MSGKSQQELHILDVYTGVCVYVVLAVTQQQQHRCCCPCIMSPQGKASPASSPRQQQAHSQRASHQISQHAKHIE
jgi:hypothetical protein